MKLLKLTEKIKNLNRVVDNEQINAVTEMNPVMSDAYEDSLELDKAIEDELKENDLLVKDKPFLGASEQPTPKEVEQPKLTLDESLFEDEVEEINECEEPIDYMDDSILDDVELNEARSFKDIVKIGREIELNAPHSMRAKQFDIIDKGDRKILYWVTQDPFNSFELDKFVEAALDVIPYIAPEVVQIALTQRDIGNEGFENDNSKGNILWLDAPDFTYDVDNWKDISHKMGSEEIDTTEFEDELIDSDKVDLEFTDDDFEDYTESLNEEDKSNIPWDELGTEEAENVDIWNLVYSTLLKERDLAAQNMVKRYKTPELPLKQRYSEENISTDMDGNIIVYAETEEDLEPAKEVAEFHRFENRSKKSPDAWSIKRPDQVYSLTIIIPEEELNRSLERRNPGKGRGRPKKIKEEK